MKNLKKITVLFTVLLMLAASSAFAASAVVPAFPAAFNGTLGALHGSETGSYQIFTGFALNGTTNSATSGDFNGVGSQTMFVANSTTADSSDVFLINGTTGSINGTFIAFNGSAQARKSFDNGTTAANAEPAFNFNAAYGSMTGLTEYGVSNSTFNSTMLFVPAGNYQMMVGFINATLNSTATSGEHAYMPQYAGKGLAMPITYANGTFGSVESSSDVWDYYSFGQTKNYPTFTIAQVKITAASGNANAAVKYFVDNGTLLTDATTSWVSYNATNLSNDSLTLSTTGHRTLIENATINADKNLITGIVSNVKNERAYVVMIKNGSNLATTDLTNRGFKMIYLGSNDGSGLGNATSGLQSLTFDNSLVITQGSSRVQYPVASGSGAANVFASFTGNLGNYVGALASTSRFGVSQSNMTTYGTDGSTVVSSFYGKQSADKTFSVGIYEGLDANGGNSTYALGFLIPDAAAVSEISAAGAGYQANATINVTRLANNATGYSATALRARWSGIPSNFSPLTDVKGYTATINPGAKGSVYYTAQYAFTGLGGKIANLRLYKVSPHSTSSWNLGYASAATPSVDGAWWISTNTAGGYLNNNSVLDPTADYYLNWVIKDNGSYDANSTLANSIVDPVVLGSVPTSSSSSSSGCVFNPAAGFGLEWLLLMLAPMVAIVRSRFKK